MHFRSWICSWFLQAAHSRWKDLQCSLLPLFCYHNHISSSSDNHVLFHITPSSDVLVFIHILWLCTCVLWHPSCPSQSCINEKHTPWLIHHILLLKICIGRIISKDHALLSVVTVFITWMQTGSTDIRTRTFFQDYASASCKFCHCNARTFHPQLSWMHLGVGQGCYGFTTGRDSHLARIGIE